MKKILLLLLVFVSVSFISKSQTKEWTFGVAPFAGTTYSTTTTVDGLTIMAGEKSTVVVDENPKKNGDYAFTHRAKLGGAGAPAEESPNMPTTRAFVFDVTGSSIITVAALSSSGSEDRQLLLTNGTELIHTYQAPGKYTDADKNNIGLESFDYEGGAGTLYLFSASSGVNVYLIKVEAESSSSISADKADKGVIVSAEYYDIAGRKVTDSTKGLLIKKAVYENGSVETSKVFVY